MSRIYNFNAGPSTLPLSVLEEVRDELVEYKGCGRSILEASHRSGEYDEIHNSAQGLLRELLGLSKEHIILFLGGGATLQFSMVPMNLLGKDQSCDFTLTGSWSKKAYQDHSKLGKTRVVFDGKDEKYTSLPDPATLKVDPKASYLHLTSNETIGGVQWQSWPNPEGVPLVCDMSSDFLSRPVPVDRFGLIYAGAQKNIGPAGVTVVILRPDMLERSPDTLTAYLDYKIHAGKNSLYNTPPAFAIYMVEKVLQWLKKNGGLGGAETLAKKRSELLYGAMASHSEFYKCPVASHCRSKMNVVFRLPSEELEKQFIAQAEQEGLGGLKGHRSVGGCRASIYNAMPMEGVEALVDLMDRFAKAHG